jgi:hypothetical protein
VTDHVHSLKGTHYGDEYRLATERLTFRGVDAYPSVTSFNGRVDITFRWSFTRREQL